MRKANQFCLILCLALVSYMQVSFALQTIPFTENAVIPLAISRDTLTKIVVTHDKITEVRGAVDSYNLKNDPNEGSIFILPQTDNDKPFTLFLTTINAKHLMLNITPASMNADTVLLTYSSPVKKAIHRQLVSKAITAAMLLKEMQQDQVNSSFNLIELNKRLPSIGAIEPTLIRIYANPHQPWTGQVIRLTNSSWLNQKLDQSLLSCQHCVAIAMVQDNLAPNMTTTLYRVVQNGK